LTAIWPNNQISSIGVFKASTKQGLVPGDKLVLSKPLGTGVILAGAMQDHCTGSVFNQALDTMMQVNDQAAKTLSILNVKACTDVTGFGLLGHLQEL
jgi:selenide,water dikinase